MRGLTGDVYRHSSARPLIFVTKVANNLGLWQVFNVLRYTDDACPAVMIRVVGSLARIRLQPASGDQQGRGHSQRGKPAPLLSPCPEKHRSVCVTSGEHRDVVTPPETFCWTPESLDRGPAGACYCYTETLHLSCLCNSKVSTAPNFAVTRRYTLSQHGVLLKEEILFRKMLGSRTRDRGRPCRSRNSATHATRTVLR